jgi:hypothetical protein
MRIACFRSTVPYNSGAQLKQRLFLYPVLQAFPFLALSPLTPDKVGTSVNTLCWQRQKRVAGVWSVGHVMSMRRHCLEIANFGGFLMAGFGFSHQMHSR